MVLKVYVAASSAELDRARKAMEFCRSHGIEITYDWATPFNASDDMTEAEREQVANHEARGVKRCDIIWVLMPVTGGAGVHTELGIAIGRDLGGPSILVSGALGRNIFDALADARFATDEEAGAWLIAEDRNS